MLNVFNNYGALFSESIFLKAFTNKTQNVLCTQKLFPTKLKPISEHATLNIHIICLK